MTDEVPYPIPSGWEWATLGHICQIIRTQIDPKLRPKDEFNYLSIENIESNFGELVDFAPTLGQEIRSSKIAFTTSDVLYSKLRPYLNKVHVPSFNGVSATDLIPIRPLGEIPREYLAYFLRTRFVVEYAKQRTRGIQLPRVPVEDLLRLPVPLAPLAEQKRIVAKAQDSIKAIREARKALVRFPSLVKQLRRSVLAKAFRGELTQGDPSDEPVAILIEKIRQELRKKWEEGLRAKGRDPRKYKYEEPEPVETDGLSNLPNGWTWTNIGTIATFIGSGITPLGGQSVYVSKGIHFIRSQNVHPDGLHLDDIVYVTPNMHAKMKRTHVQPGDVLLNITGASIGRSTYVPDDFGEANVNQHVCIIRSPWLIPAYLSAFLNSPLGQEQIFATESGVTREGLNYAQIRNLKIPLAPVNEQSRLVGRILRLFAQTSLTEVAVRNGFKNVRELEESILAKAFRGELVPQDPNDEPASALLKRISDARIEMRKRAPRKEFVGESITQLRAPEPRMPSKRAVETIRAIIDKMGGEAEVTRVFEASRLSMNDFWDMASAEIKEGRIQRVQRNGSVFLRSKR